MLDVRGVRWGGALGIWEGGFGGVGGWEDGDGGLVSRGFGGGRGEGRWLMRELVGGLGLLALVLYRSFERG